MLRRVFEVREPPAGRWRGRPFSAPRRARSRRFGDRSRRRSSGRRAAVPSRHGAGRRKECRFQPPQSAAFCEIRAAKGWVASISRSKFPAAGIAARPSLPPKPPMRVATGWAMGSAVRPASESSRSQSPRCGKRCRQIAAPRSCRRESGCGVCSWLTTVPSYGNERAMADDRRPRRRWSSRSRRRGQAAASPRLPSSSAAGAHLELAAPLIAGETPCCG